jgi:hypothetical protein
VEQFGHFASFQENDPFRGTKKLEASENTTMTFNRQEENHSSREFTSSVAWPSAKEPVQPKAVYEDDRPLPTLAKAAALVEDRPLPTLAKAAALAEKQQLPPRKVPEQPKQPAKPQPAKKGPNVEAMKNTLAALKEEKSTLEEKLKRNRSDTDTQFELELV